MIRKETTTKTCAYYLQRKYNKSRIMNILVMVLAINIEVNENDKNMLNKCRFHKDIKIVIKII